MKNFTIRQLEDFSGIKAHTLRMWEQRFSLLKPERNKTNFRYYTLDDLKLLLNVSLLNNSGFKISQIAQIDRLSLEEKAEQLVKENARKTRSINNLILFMFCMDVEGFDNELDKCLITWDIDTTIKQIIVPFLERVNILSYNDSSSEVHFAVTSIRKKIIFGIEKLNATKSVDKTALLFLPEKEHYDLMLLCMMYHLKSAGLKVLYLGTNISTENLKRVVSLKRPDFLLTYLTPKVKFEVESILNYLSNHSPQSTLVVSGYASHILPKETVTNLKITSPAKISEVIC